MKRAFMLQLRRTLELVSLVGTGIKWPTVSIKKKERGSNVFVGSTSLNLLCQLHQIKCPLTFQIQKFD